ncbi:unnamed protein product [Schistosoma rodhaini]|uniref:G_PROTEIN_RECEP_F1_2 domain-containing protein n=1 Tax=Schistosoma rodhaini TaxID=6188 RepID=A0AA85FPY4_9TREM|nr:unnamed protein product [Schistosoma rodhaini]
MRAKFNSTDFYTPLDTLVDCLMLEQGHPNASKILCHISIFLGSFMAYVFPVIGVADLISNCIVATIFLYYLQHIRQFVYLGVLALSDISIVITIGWLRWFPTFGLPFATAGNTYYFISLTSTTSCKLYVFFQSLTCIFRGNIFLIMAFDRLLLIHKPLLFKKHPKYTVWIIITTVFIISIIMSLPISIYSDFILVTNRNICWQKFYTDFLVIYQALFSYTSLTQFLIVIMIDTSFLVSVVRWSRSRPQPMDTQTSKMTSNGRTITMLALHTFAFLCALPCVISYLLSITFHRPNHKLSEEYVRFILLFVNIGWNLIFLQSSLNIVLYCFRINKFKRILLKPLTNYRNKTSTFGKRSI